MKFIADLHIHSKYSRATAKNLDFENLYYAAQIKGVSVIGTGDFTYPAWVDEIESKLEETEPGLFSLKKELADEIDKTVPKNCRIPVRFILQAEISNIYKKDGRVRKNHNLIYFPDLASVKKFNTRLDAIGNITSDGRPILGLDAADLLALMLEINDKGFFVPAHIWTPWFSMFGSKSGFDTMEACFGDLKKYIFAVETGLSSDPPMNWRVKDLDDMCLISNSDAHSPGYLGRNASVFDTQLSFAHIRQALETKDLQRYLGTLDMFPHQGKYHYDGHRNCNVCLNPEVTLELNGICPECGKALTCGVLYRVQQLAGRPEGYQPGNRHAYKSIIPLTDILSEIFAVGPKTKKVTTYYNRAIEALGSELDILLNHPFEQLETAKVPLLPEAIMKMRSGDINIDPGYDGEFGKVNIFSDAEKLQLQGERYPLFALPQKKIRKAEAKKRPKAVQARSQKGSPRKSGSISSQGDVKLSLLDSLNPAQKKAVESSSKRIIIQAGPGTGKTRTLTARIAYLISQKNVDPGNILALTFTNKAAGQLSQRIEKYVDQKETSVTASTFHAFCLDILKRHMGLTAMIADDFQSQWLIRTATGGGLKKKEQKKIEQQISLCKQQLLSWQDDLGALIDGDQLSAFKAIYKSYDDLCKEYDLIDFEDLIAKTVTLLNENENILAAVQNQYLYVLIDEYQDLNFGQYALVKLICRKNDLFVIGDPDQSIYGFRGSDNAYFKRFAMDFSDGHKIELIHNYRSTQTILDASFQVVSGSEQKDGKPKIISHTGSMRRLIIKESNSDQSEAITIARMIEGLVGGTSFFSMDTGRSESCEQKEYGFEDFAILYRTSKQCEIIAGVLEKQGIPFQSADKKRWFGVEQIQKLITLCKVFEKIKAGQSPDDLSMAQLSDIFGRTRQSQKQISEILKACRALDHNDDACDLLVRKVFQITGFSDQLNDNPPLKDAYENILSIAGNHGSLKSFLDALALNQDADTIGFNAQKVSLMTIHAAKGLEYPVVFVAGCEQGLIPYARDGKNVENLEEERRLFYVAMTRAMDILCLTYAKKRRIYGSIEKRQRSFFIEDIEKKLTQFEKVPFKLSVGKKERQLELF